MEQSTADRNAHILFVYYDEVTKVKLNCLEKNIQGLNAQIEQLCQQVEVANNDLKILRKAKVRRRIIYYYTA